MTILDKILLSMAFIGFIGCLVNMSMEADADNWRSHTYSTMLLIGAGSIFVMHAIWA